MEFDTEKPYQEKENENEILTKLTLVQFFIIFGEIKSLKISRKNCLIDKSEPVEDESSEEEDENYGFCLSFGDTVPCY